MVGWLERAISPTCAAHSEHRLRQLSQPAAATSLAPSTIAVPTTSVASASAVTAATAAAQAFAPSTIAVPTTSFAAVTAATLALAAASASA